MEQYNTLANDGQSALIEKKSRFLGFAVRLQSTAAAESHLAGLRKTYADANHVVFAYRMLLPEQYSRFSDDGEPKGTAGPPLMDALTGAGLYHAGLFVVRYFGGTKLGTGGLVRAYGKCASLALEAAGICTQTRVRRYQVTVGYDMGERVQDGLQRSGFVISQVQFLAQVSFQVAVPLARVENFESQILDLSAGQADVLQLDDSYLPMAKEATIKGTNPA
ncbi:MAG TPA: DUF1949 domain-containing protein [Clostridiaceae bacterium]|jgi:uncharacterized YigZ family protein|nr:DUF1949 domain-containing protein [Clostridiaceae bacterium]